MEAVTLEATHLEGTGDDFSRFYRPHSFVEYGLRLGRDGRRVDKNLSS